MAAAPALAEIFAAPVVGVMSPEPEQWQSPAVAVIAAEEKRRPPTLPHLDYDLNVFYGLMETLSAYHLCSRCGARFRERDNLSARRCFVHPLPVATFDGEGGVERAEWMCCGASENFGAPNFDARTPQGCTVAHHTATDTDVAAVFDVVPKQLYAPGLLGDPPEDAVLIRSWAEHAAPITLVRRPRTGAHEVSRRHGPRATETFRPADLFEFSERLSDALEAVAGGMGGAGVADLFAVHDATGVHAALERKARNDAKGEDPFIPYYIVSRIAPVRDERRVRSIRALPKRR